VKHFVSYSIFEVVRMDTSDRGKRKRADRLSPDTELNDPKKMLLSTPSSVLTVFVPPLTALGHMHDHHQAIRDAKQHHKSVSRLRVERPKNPHAKQIKDGGALTSPVLNALFLPEEHKIHRDEQRTVESKSEVHRLMSGLRLDEPDVPELKL
jgi:hypothetical protein